MIDKNFEDRFSMDIDNYMNGKEKLNIEDKEYNELLEFGKTLSQEDFSKNSNKEKIFKSSLENVRKHKGENNMEKSKKTIIKVASIALVCILGISIIRPSFAQEFVDKIVNFISIGHVTVVEEQANENELIKIPEVFKGKIFDKNGNPIEIIKVDEFEKIYTVHGEEIANLDIETGNIITVSESEKMLEENRLVVKDIDKLNDYTCFEVILPSYLPKGYAFDKAGLFKDADGIVDNSKVIELFFTNDNTGEFIYMQQRFADEETAYVTGGQKVEQLKINGVDAILYDNILDWEDNGVIYMLNGRGISRDELIKTAESFK